MFLNPNEVLFLFLWYTHKYKFFHLKKLLRPYYAPSTFLGNGDLSVEEQTENPARTEHLYVKTWMQI